MTSLDDAPRILADVPLEIDPAEVLRFQGYRRGDSPGTEVGTLFDEALALGRSLMQPRALVRWLPVAALEPDRVTVEGVVLTIPRVQALWGTFEFLGVAICTIGEAVEERVRRLWDARELPLAAMLDSVGSGAVESLAEYVNDSLCQEGLAAGLRVTNRVSPGYGDWDVREQQVLFQLCPPAAIGITLNTASFMTPVKSISLLVGAGSTARVDHYFSQCARCWMRGCAYRRAPAARTVRRADA